MINTEKELRMAILEITQQRLAAGGPAINSDLLHIFHAETCNAAMHTFKGNQLKSAAALGINRSTLRKRLSEDSKLWDSRLQANIASRVCMRQDTR